MSPETPVLNLLRVFSFLSQDDVPTSGAFAVPHPEDASRTPPHV